jgi:hypothetical protein
MENLIEKLQEWQNKGLITISTTKNILQYEEDQQQKTTQTQIASTPNKLGEALAYIGGLVILSGMYAMLDEYWEQMSVVLRQVIITTITGIFIGTGISLINNSLSSLQRLGGFLTTLSVFGVFGTAIHALTELFDINEDLAFSISCFCMTFAAFFAARTLSPLVGAFVHASTILLQYCTASSAFAGQLMLYSEVLQWDFNVSMMLSAIIGIIIAGYHWFHNQTALLHSVTFTYVFLLFWSSIDLCYTEPDVLHYGIGLWIMSSLWLTLSICRLFNPNDTGIFMASVVLFCAALGITFDYELIGSAMLLVSGIALITCSTWQFHSRIFTIGSLAILISSPILIYQLFENILPTSIVLIICGAFLLLVGVLLIRVRREIYTVQ